MAGMWVEGGFLDNLNKFSNSFGYDNAATAIHLAMVPWESVDDRDLFIQSVTGKPVQGDSTRSFN